MRRILKRLGSAKTVFATAFLSLSLAFALASAGCAIAEALLIPRFEFGPVDRLAVVTMDSQTPGSYVGLDSLDYAEFRRSVGDLAEAIGAYDDAPISLTVNDKRSALNHRLIFQISSGLLGVLRSRPLLGREFSPDDEKLGDASPVMLSYSYWKNSFGADPSVIGRRIIIETRPHQIIGVTPANLDIFQKSVGYEPDLMQAIDLAIGHGLSQYLDKVVLRVRPGVSLDELSSRVKLAAKALRAEYPNEFSGAAFHVQWLAASVTESVRAPMRLAGVALVVVIAACLFNFACLILARLQQRRFELTTRVALGARRAVLAADIVGESLFTALLAAFAGTLVARPVLSLILRLSSDLIAIPRLSDASVDLRVVSLVLALAVGTALLAALPSLVRIARGDLGGIPTRTPHQSAFRTRKLLLVAQISVSVILVAGAVSALRTIRAAISRGLGYDFRNVLALNVDPSSDLGQSEEVWRSYFETLRTGIGRMPGVEAVGEMDPSPISVSIIRRLRCPALPPPGILSGSWRVVGGDWARAMGLPIVSGQIPDIHLDQTHLPVVVSETIANRFRAAGLDAVGSELEGLNPRRPAKFQIAAVVRDPRESLMDESVSPTFFVVDSWPNFTVLVRAAEASAIPRLEADVVSLIRANGHKAAVDRIETLEHRALRTMAAPALLAASLTMFGVTALVMILAGNLGIMMEWTRARQREFAIRMALGAREIDVVAMVLRQTALISAVGVAAGLLLSAAVAGVWEAAVFGTRPPSVSDLALAAIALMCVSLGACWVVALRAARAAPSQFLKVD